MRENRSPRLNQGATRIVEHDLQVHVYRVTEADLDNLFHAGTNLMIYLSAAMALAGILATQIAVYISGLPQESFIARAFPGFTFATVVLLIIFSVLTFRSYKQRTSAFNRIKNPSSQEPNLSR